MALTSSPVFFDTSVLVAGLIEIDDQSTAPLELLDAVAERRIAHPVTAWHCCLEFYSVTTRLPEAFRLAPEVALRLLQDEILERFEIYGLPAGERQRFLHDAVAERTIGGRIYDAHIGEVARLSGAETVITDNRRHFTALLRHGVRVLLSSEALEELENR